MGGEEIHAVSGIDLEIRKGEYVAIMGPSGSGKSTLMNLIGCLDSPSSGLYYLNGHLASQMTDAELARVRNRARERNQASAQAAWVQPAWA